MTRIGLLTDAPGTPTSPAILRALRAALGPRRCVLLAERRPAPGLWTAEERRAFKPCGPLWRGLAAVCRSEHISTVHLHVHTYRAARAAPAARASRTGARLVTTFHFTPSEELDRRAYRSVLDASDRVVAPSRSLRREIVAAFPEQVGRILVVPNGVDSDFFRPGPARVSVRPYVACVAKLAYYKGTDVLLMAFRELVDRGHDLDLVLCGPVRPPFDWRRMVRLLRLEERVRVVPTCGRTRVRAILRGSLFFVLASRWEAHSLALLEALACGKSAAATNVGDHAAVLRRGPCGLSVPARDPQALSRAMDRLARDSRLRARLEAAARRTAAAYSWTRTAKSYEDIYRAVAVSKIFSASASAAIR